MSKVAVHMRIANLNPSNEEVVSRQQAINHLVTNWTLPQDLGDSILRAHAISIALGGDGKPDEKLGLEVEKAIQQTAPAYLYRERPLDVGVCAALAALELVTSESEEHGKSHHDILAATLWSALAYQAQLGDSRRETLRAELNAACTTRCSDAAEAARERMDVEKFDEDDEEAAIEDVKQTAANAIASLDYNATLDREELNFLWWALLNRSRLLKKPLSAIHEAVRVVSSAIEAARFLTALPSEVHRDLVLRTIDADPVFDHEALLKKIGADRAALNGVFGDVDIVEQAPEAFPLLYSLKTGKATGSGASVGRTSSEWASRALLEAAIVQLYLNEASPS